MNKTEYRQARRLLRDNGRYALRWVSERTRMELSHLLFNIQDSTDYLAERADVVAWCTRDKVPYNFRHLAIGKQIFDKNGRSK